MRRMPCHIYLRRGQPSSQRDKYALPNRAKIFAPTWVRAALLTLGERLNGTTFEVFEKPPTWSHNPLETLTITENFNNQSLKLLQKIARNEPSNVSGKIDFDLYAGIKSRAVIYSIRDLVRQCVIVGVDESSSYGGYGCRSATQPKQRVYLCDLAALQFQQEYNTGRHILIQENGDPHAGILDDVIFEQVVGEKKRSFQEVLNLSKNEREKRYISRKIARKSLFLDSHAYRRFVGRDVLLSGLALSEMASTRGDQINFKFLKYGTGFFAGIYQSELESLILSGVLDGLEELFAMESPKVRATIKRVELPFYNQDLESAKRLDKFKQEYGVDIIFSKVDALKNTAENLKVATTNCGDNHAACGNEMGFSSVDAAIAENLESKGNLLCPLINTKIDEEYLDISSEEKPRNDSTREEAGSNQPEPEAPSALSAVVDCDLNVGNAERKAIGLGHGQINTENDENKMDTTSGENQKENPAREKSGCDQAEDVSGDPAGMDAGNERVEASKL